MQHHCRHNQRQHQHQHRQQCRWHKQFRHQITTRSRTNSTNLDYPTYSICDSDNSKYPQHQQQPQHLTHGTTSNKRQYNIGDNSDGSKTNLSKTTATTTTALLTMVRQRYQQLQQPRHHIAGHHNPLSPSPSTTATAAPAAVTLFNPQHDQQCQHNKSTSDQCQPTLLITTASTSAMATAAGSTSTPQCILSPDQPKLFDSRTFSHYRNLHPWH